MKVYDENGKLMPPPEQAKDFFNMTSILGRLEWRNYKIDYENRLKKLS